MSDKDKKQAPHTLHDYSPPEDNQDGDTIFPQEPSPIEEESGQRKEQRDAEEEE